LHLCSEAGEDAQDDTKRSRRLKTRKELDPRNYREEGGVLICLGKGGEPLLYNGFHRFAMSLILELPVIPASARVRGQERAQKPGTVPTPAGGGDPVRGVIITPARKAIPRTTTRNRSGARR
jgi:hypothetical protein